MKVELRLQTRLARQSLYRCHGASLTLGCPLEVQIVGELMDTDIGHFSALILSILEKFRAHSSSQN